MSDLNDPRVFFAAERTLLAWNRTALAMMAFGFAIERFGLLLHTVMPNAAGPSRNASFWLGVTLVLLGAAFAALSVLQYRKVLLTLRPIEIPDRYAVNLGVIATLAIAGLGIVLAIYLMLTA